MLHEVGYLSKILGVVAIFRIYDRIIQTEVQTDLRTILSAEGITPYA